MNELIVAKRLFSKEKEKPVSNSIQKREKKQKNKRSALVNGSRNMRTTNKNHDC